MNIATLTTIEITVVRYFFLLRLRLFEAISPPTPKSFLVSLDVRYGLLFFTLISLLPLIATSGGILDARSAMKNDEQNIVTAERTIAQIIGIVGVTNTNVAPLSISLRTLLSIVIRIAFTPSPRSMPRGIPIKPRMKPSKITFLRICLLVAPTDASIPYILVFSVIEIAKLLRITNTLASITIIMIITARLKITVFVASFEP